MEPDTYDVWYDPNEVDQTNRVRVLRAWARPELDITIGRAVLAGDGELDPVPARILSYDDATQIMLLELLYDTTQVAVA